MTVARRKGDPGKADMLFSRLVRSRGQCERCGDNTLVNLTTAHIVRRRYSATRCVEDNAWCLCYRCHRITEDDPFEFTSLVDVTIGAVRYVDLRSTAERGIQTSSALWWRAEVERLTERCKEVGVDTRWRAA